MLRKTFQLTRRVLVIVLTGIAIPALAAAPTPPYGLNDMQGDLMIWAPTLVPACTHTNMYGEPDDPITHIACVGTSYDSNHVLRHPTPQGILSGWVWSLSVARYPAAQRQVLYSAAIAAGYTHFALNVTACLVSTMGDPDGTAYRGMYPVSQADCTNWLGTGSSYDQTLNTVLTELIANHLTPICAGVSATHPVAPGLNRSLCSVVMDNWDDNALSNDSMDCRIRAVAQTFPNALLYFELPSQYMPFSFPADTCSPTPFPSTVSAWLANIQQQYPHFAGVLYEVDVAVANGVASSVSAVSAAHNAGWANTQEVRFETDTYDKFWNNANLTTERVNNDTLQSQAPFMVGFMSGGTAHGATVIADDVDGNGLPDIVSETVGGSAALSVNVGSGAFQTVQGSSYNIGTNWRAIDAGDFNGDGKPDLVWQERSTGQVVVWLNTGTMTFTSANLSTVTSIWRVVAVADMDRDGNADLIWQSDTGQVVCWYMHGTTLDHSAYLSSAASTWRVTGARDFNADGYPDLVWQSSTGAVQVWYMNGTAMTSWAWIFNGASVWKVVTVGDLNGDGKPDLIWRNTDGTFLAWYMSGVTKTGYNYIVPTASGWQLQ